jgi:predicted Rossmann fold flavoprotein
VRAENWPVVVVGAGAAGLLAALFAARAGARVLVLETRPRPGAKIRVSGGGRCNVLPVATTLDDFHTSGSRHALRNVLFSWPLADVREFFERDLGVPLKAEPTGKLFPVSERPLDIVEALLAACARAGAVLVCGARVTSLARSADTSFDLRTEGGDAYSCQRLVLATGGLSLPKSGSDGGGLALARALGCAAAPTYPALVPLTTSEPRWTALAGVSLPVQLQARRGDRAVETREREFLFTHRGFSGPVVLDMSRHVTAPESGGVRLVARWGGAAAPDWDVALRPAGKRLVATLLREHFPDRLADTFLDVAEVPRDRRESDLTRDERRRLATILGAYDLPIRGDEGYATAEVTAGGVALTEVSPRTLESRTVPHLYFCGEMLDVVGRIGGHNFLWAWVSGRRAGVSAAASLSG